MKIVRFTGGLLSLTIFLILQLGFYDRYEFGDWRSLAVQAFAMLFAATAVICLMPKRKSVQGAALVKKQDKPGLGKRTIVAAIMVLIAIPSTIYIGIKFFADKQYYAISTLILIEIMLPFFVSFEKKRPDAKELMMISLICAIAVAGRMVFFMLPQFKPVVAMVIIAGVCFGGETGFLVGAICAFVSNFYFGQGPWTPWQMFAYGLVGFLAGVVFQKNIFRTTKINLCIFGGLSTVLILGGILNPSSLIMMGETLSLQALAVTYAAGLPFDLMHALATILFLWVLAEPVIEKLERVKSKYGLL